MAGGYGTRLKPVTIPISKQLLPVYDKPMIYYPLTTLMTIGVKEILIISTSEDIPRFKKLLKNGNQWGIDISYTIQKKPEGIAQAFVLGKDFIDNKPNVLILGDNIFHVQNFSKILNNANNCVNEATIFAYKVNDPERYGVVEIDNSNKIIDIIEKPKDPKSNLAITGLYFFDKNVCKYAMKLKKSSRGELEITDLNKLYLENDKLRLEKFEQGTAWLDAGTHDSLLEASQFIATIEKRQGIKIACPEEVAFLSKWINKKQIGKLISELDNSSYGDYLKKVFNIEK